MKIRALGVVVLAAAVTGSASAQPPAGGPNQGPRGGRQVMRGPGGPGGGRMMGGMMGGRGMFGGGANPIEPRQFARYEAKLNLTDDQKDAAQTLFEGYQAELKAADDAAQARRREAMEKFRESQDPGAFDAVREVMQKAQEQRAKAEKSLLTDVQSLLSKDQQAQWAGVERAYRRDQGLKRGRLSGERMDVTLLVEDAKLDDKAAAAVAPVLEQYENALDRELAARNAVYDDIEKKIGEIMRSGDVEEAQKELDRARDAGLKVREINKRYARQALEALPEDKRAEFATLVKRATQPGVYRESRVARHLDAAAKFGDLDETQKKAIEDLRSRHAREYGQLQDRLAAALEEQELKISAADLAGRFRGGPGANQGPGQDIRDEMRTYEDGAAQQLKGILKPAQLEQLPKDDGQDAGRGRRRNADGIAPPPPPSGG